MRRLLPDAARLPLDELYAGLTLDWPVRAEGSWIAVCMVSSVDGAVAVEGRSAGLGGPADLRALSRLRGANDVSLVGAATVRAEGYRPLTGGSRRRADRTSRGLRAAPRLAIVTATGALDADAPVFAEPDEAPIVLAAAGCPPDRLRALERVAEVRELPARAEPGIAAADVAAQLVADGLPRILLEGGPRLNAAFLAAGLIDEVFVTLAASAVGGDAGRIVQSGTEAPTRLTLVSAYEHDSELLLRYRAGA